MENENEIQYFLVYRLDANNREIPAVKRLTSEEEANKMAKSAGERYHVRLMTAKEIAAKD